jgi:hypothetical protein
MTWRWDRSSTRYPPVLAWRAAGVSVSSSPDAQVPKSKSSAADLPPRAGMVRPSASCQATVKLTPFGPVLIPTPIMLSCYRFLPPFSDLFSVVTSGSLVVFSGSTPVNLDRINPLLRFSRRR